MGKRFEQYLPLVMGPVLKTAAMKPEVALLDNEDMQGVEGDDAWQFVSLGDQQNFGIRTAGMYMIIIELVNLQILLFNCISFK